MPIRTVTYNTDTHKVVPLKSTDDMMELGKSFPGGKMLVSAIYEQMVSDAPELPETDGWMPIETAPKDKFIDLWLVHLNNDWTERYAECIWHETNGWVQPNINGGIVVVRYDDVKVTHWMPRPKPPQSNT